MAKVKVEEAQATRAGEMGLTVETLALRLLEAALEGVGITMADGRRVGTLDGKLCLLCARSGRHVEGGVVCHCFCHPARALLKEARER